MTPKDTHLSFLGYPTINVTQKLPVGRARRFNSCSCRVALRHGQPAEMVALKLTTLRCTDWPGRSCWVGGWVGKMRIAMKHGENRGITGCFHVFVWFSIGIKGGNGEIIRTTILDSTSQAEFVVNQMRNNWKLGMTFSKDGKSLGMDCAWMTILPALGSTFLETSGEMRHSEVGNRVSMCGCIHGFFHTLNQT